MDMTWNIGLDAGKAAPAPTDSATPFTEMTAAVTGGAGGAGGAGGVTGGLADPPPEVAPDELLDVFPAKGSLLSKSENDCSWPVPAAGLTAETSPAVGTLAAGVAVDASGEVVPASVGAAVGAAVVGAGVGVGV